jgi:hypothetical protein
MTMVKTPVEIDSEALALAAAGDEDGLFRLLQAKTEEAWEEQLGPQASSRPAR